MPHSASDTAERTTSRWAAPSGMDLRKANGVTKAINLATNVAALAVYLLSGKVLMTLGLTAGLFSIAGNYIGARFFSSKGSKSVKPVILIVLGIFFIRELTEILG